MADKDELQVDAGRVSRRRVLKGAGAGAALAWSAPAIFTVQRAGAQGSPPPGTGDCASAVLSGGPGGTENVDVDDDLQIFVNGTSVFVDDDEFASAHPPISVGPVSNGDQIRVVASDSEIFGGNRFLSPLYLHCPSTGAVQTLDANGHPPDCCYAPVPGGVVFYDQTFTVAL